MHLHLERPGRSMRHAYAKCQGWYASSDASDSFMLSRTDLTHVKGFASPLPGVSADEITDM